jgi:hypothetical protein
MLAASFDNVLVRGVAWWWTMRLNGLALVHGVAWWWSWWLNGLARFNAL